MENNKWYNSKKSRRSVILMMLSGVFLFVSLSRFWYYGTLYNTYETQFILYQNGKLTLTALQLAQLKTNISVMSLSSYETGILFIAIVVLFLTSFVATFFAWNNWDGTQ